jgi:diguanylate cyclase (GGDEF)-like protein
MQIAKPRSSRRVPLRALVLSLAALLVPMAGALLFNESLGLYAPLLWLMALVPAFLLAYYRGWRGVATALASGMAALSLTQVVASWMGLGVPDLLLGVVVAYVGISLGIGWLAERLLTERDQVEDMAFTDTLTHLPNRRHARVFLENEFAAAQRGRMLSVVLFDLDDFKKFNDKHGHAAGDEALRSFAEILTRTTRRMNLSARLGGEEFLSVLAGSESEGAVTFADRVRTAMHATKLHGQTVSVSGGVATFHPSMRTPDELLAAADHALYQAKREGRNCIRLFGSAALGRAEPSADATAPAPAPMRDPAYPRPPEEIGRTKPPVELLPQQITTFGAGRRALLVEDEHQVRKLIATYMSREGFAVAESDNVPDGVKQLGEEFDVVVTDIRMPEVSGTELVGAVKSRWPATQVIVITGLQDPQVAADALNQGADRYLFKPFGMPELRAHLKDALTRRDRLLAERSEKHVLSSEAQARAEQSLDALLRAARALVRAVEVRDPYTRGHSDRVGRYAVALAEILNRDGLGIDLDALKLACELHDVGKIGIPDAILNKVGALSPDEVALVRKHPRTGRRILDPLLDDETVLSVVSWHHERWDGNGYPDGLVGEGIPIVARIVGVADALDAMTSDRAYRPALAWEEAMDQLGQLSGKQFDPALVACVKREQERLREILAGHAHAGV